MQNVTKQIQKYIEKINNGITRNQKRYIARRLDYFADHIDPRCILPFPLVAYDGDILSYCSYLLAHTDCIDD